MIRISRLFTSTALATLIAVPATAEISANDVWNGFTTYYNAIGLKVDATETRSGNRLTIGDLKISADFPFGLGSLIITTTDVDLLENTDGTVDILAPESMPLAVAITLPNDTFITTTIDYNQTGYRAQAAGDPDEFTVTTRITSAEMAMKGINLTGSKAKDMEFDISFTASVRDVDSETRLSMGDLLEISQNARVGTSSAEARFTRNDAHKGAVESTMSIMIFDMQSNRTAAIPPAGIDLMKLPEQLRQGMFFQVTSEIQQRKSVQRVTINGEPVSEQASTVNGSEVTLNLSRDGAQLAAKSDMSVIDLTLAELSFPFKASSSNGVANFKIPLLKSDDDQEFTYMVALDELTISDDLWNLFDTDTVLSREPGRFLVDLSGKVRLFDDLLDFIAIRNVIENGTKIAELTSLTLNGMDISAVGTTLTGTGAFTFDNSDMTTFQGLPAPSGTASLQISGLNALMDNLIKMGALENDAVFGMRMGLGLFTVAGDGDDTLVSDIEVKPDGQILANGKRIK